MKNKLTVLALLILLFSGMSYAQLTISNPVNGSTGVSLTPNIQWSTATAGVTDYWLRIDDANPGFIFDADVNLATNNNTFTLNYNTTYTVTVWASFNGGGAWPEQISTTFTTVTTLNSVSNLAPNGLVNQSLTPTLSWDAATGGTAPYSYVVNIYDNLAVLIHTSPSQAGLTYSVPAGLLGYSANFTWEVVANDASFPIQTATSATAAFSTLALPAPVLTTPVNSSISNSSPSNLIWNNIPLANTYWVRISSNPGAIAPYLFDGNVGNVTTYGVATIPNTTYYVILWSSTDAGATWSSASSVYSFTTALATPSLTLPADFATGQVITPSLSWTLLGNPTNVKYYIDYDLDGELAVTKMTTGPHLTSPQNLPTLLYNTSYIWQVRAVVDGAVPNNTETTTSLTRTFVTQNIPAPVLTAPANTLTGVPIRPTFSWTWSGIGAVTYRLEVSTSNTFATTVIDTTGLNTLSLLMPEYHKLSNNITYYWRVTVTQGLNSSTSAISSFSTTPVVIISPINPINGSTGAYFDPTYFSFQVVNGFTGTLKYLVQYHVKTTVPTIAEWAGANTFTLTNLLSELPYPITLLANSKYYWRVVVLNASDEVVSYSGNYYFTTKSGAPTPYLSYPIGGQPVATNSPSFFWYIGTYDLTNITFDLEIATNAAFTLNHQAVTNINGLQYDWGLAPLIPGTTYYWRITTWYKKGNVLEQHSSTSSYSTFKAMGTGTATTPYLSYPVGGLSIYTTTPTLYWYTGASTDGVVFDVYIKLSSAGGYTQIADNTTNLYFDMSGPLLNTFTLAAGSTYNWYVVATGGNGAFTSSVSSFVVNSSLGTGSVIASWPLGNPYVYSLTPTLYWYMYGSQTGLTKYVIKYSQTNTDLTQGAWTALGGGVDLALTETSYTIPTNLTAGSKYYWAIAGYNGGSLVTSWSTGSFTVSTTTTAVNVYLSTPIGGTTVYTLTPTLYWYATGAISGITSYDITYSNTSNFLGGLPPAFVTTVNTGTDNFYTLPSNAALAGATIYWKVTVNYAGGPSTSTTGSFVIDPGSSNVVPLVGSPINNTELKATAATLSWFTPAQSKAKLSYTVEYSENSNFANAKIATGLSEPQLNISGLKENTTYYWRAKSVDPQGTSSKFSEVALFRTSGKVTGVEEQEIPSQFELSQNYPNPFNPTTVISYALPKNTFVTIKVYDMLGREIKTLVNKENAAGRYSVDWNGDDNFGSKVSTGAYVYRITASDFVSVKKMILIK